MGTVGNQNPWPPYDNYKDCSLGICTFYCPQFCYLNFPPPPQNDDSTPFSPLIIAIIGMLVSVFLLISYYTIVTRYCKRRNVQTEENEENTDLVSQRQYHTAAAGLDEASIKSITVFRYKKEEGLVEGSECAVCLSEFQENEPLRLLPKCDHAFHLPCIDTWLKSHSNCPMCRASVVSLPYPSQNQVLTTVSVNAYEIQRPSDLILVVDEERSFSNTFNDHERNFSNGEDLDSEMRNVNILSGDHLSRFNSFKRSISLGTFSSQGRLLMSDILKIDEDLQVGSNGSRKEIGSSKELIGMKRSVSTGGLVFAVHDKDKNLMLPS